MNENDSQQVKVFRSDFGSRLIWLILTSPPLIIMIAGSLFVKPLKEIDAWTMGGICVAVPQIIFVSLKIIISPDKLTYSKLFIISRSVEWDLIRKAKIDAGKTYKYSKGFYSLNLFGDKDKHLLSINLKPFTQEGVVETARAIQERSPGVVCDKTVQALARGTINELTNQGIKEIWKLLIWLFFVLFAIALIRAFVFR